MRSIILSVGGRLRRNDFLGIGIILGIITDPARGLGIVVRTGIRAGCGAGIMGAKVDGFCRV